MNLECPKCYGRIPYEGDDPLVLIDSGEVLVCPDCRQRWMFIRHPKREGEEIGMPLIKEAPQDKRLQTFISQNLSYSTKFLITNGFFIVNGELVLNERCDIHPTSYLVVDSIAIEKQEKWVDATCPFCDYHVDEMEVVYTDEKLPPIKLIRR